MTETFAAILARHYAEHPDRLALHLILDKANEQALSYRRLLEGAAGVASQLRAAGVAPGSVAVIILPHGETLVDAFWGAGLHGAVPSILPPMSEKLAPEKYRADLAALIGLTQPAVIMTNTAGAAEARTVISASGQTCALLVIDSPQFVPPDFAVLAGMRVNSGEIALLQHSSGTTGLQKGVALSHQAVFKQIDAYAQALALSPADKVVSWLPLYHDMGLIASFVMPVLFGVPSVIMSPFDWVRAPARLLQAISAHGGTLCWLPNFAFQFMATRVRDRELGGISLASMRAFINCSEPCYAQSHAAFAARFAALGLRPEALQTCYAMAENTFAVTQSVLGALVPERQNEAHLSSGRPLANVQLRVIDEHGVEVPAGQAGEILVRSDCMLSGYFHRPDLSADAFIDGFYRSGDIGALVAGELYVTGRKKDLIIVGGKNIHPNDLEQLASAVPGVHPGRVAAFGVFDADAGTEEVVIVAESDIDGADAQLALADAIRAHITQNSDVAVRIVEIVQAKWLIKTSSGKVARAANRQKYLYNR
jgi:fatty-acyl-CoA synthase